MNQIRDDLHLIADNAALFNGPDTYIAKTAEKLMKLRAQIHLDKAIARLAFDQERRTKKTKRSDRDETKTKVVRNNNESKEQTRKFGERTAAAFISRKHSGPNVTITRSCSEAKEAE